MINEGIFTESVCDEEIFFAIVCEEVSCQILPRGIWHISEEHRLDCLPDLMLGTYIASINIIGNVHNYSGPADGGLGRVYTLLYASDCCEGH